MNLGSFLDRLPETRRPGWWLALLCLLVWLPGFFSIPPGDRDESRFAQASRQMVETGDSVKQISEAVGLTYATVRTYIRRIYVKLGVHNRSQAERKLLSLNQERAQQSAQASSPGD